MSHLSRFDLSFATTDKPMPPLMASASEEEALEELTKDICELDPALAEILFEGTFSTKTREERVEQLLDWSRA